MGSGTVDIKSGHGGRVKGKHPSPAHETANSPTEDTFDAHLEGPKGLSSWRIGLRPPLGGVEALNKILILNVGSE